MRNAENERTELDAIALSLLFMLQKHNQWRVEAYSSIGDRRFDSPLRRPILAARSRVAVSYEARNLPATRPKLREYRSTS